MFLVNYISRLLTNITQASPAITVFKHYESMTTMADTSTDDDCVTSSDIGDLEKHFPFFSLPRELRDAIYGECTLDTIIQSSKPLGIAISGYFLPEMGLVCKRFQQEYEEEAVRDTELTVTAVLRAKKARRFTMGGRAKAEIERLPAAFLAGVPRLRLKLSFELFNVYRCSTSWPDEQQCIIPSFAVL